MEDYAPSIYQFRSTLEWEIAIAEWCAENEPKDNDNDTTTL